MRAVAFCLLGRHDLVVAETTESMFRIDGRLVPVVEWRKDRKRFHRPCARCGTKTFQVSRVVWKDEL